MKNSCKPEPFPATHTKPMAYDNDVISIGENINIIEIKSIIVVVIIIMTTIKEIII